MNSSEKIQVEIWSDVQCPFCYIGKRQFETALEAFPERDRVEVTWRSYQLDPTLDPVPGESIHTYLARRKGFSVERSQQMHDRVTESARAVGLDYRFDQLVVANSHAAHRLIQKAKDRGLGAEAEEALFRAYFTEGQDLASRETLEGLALTIGLTREEAAEAWDDPKKVWGPRVDAEAAEAQALGSTGVPFFVFQRRYGVTGAQGEETFLKVLQTVSRP